MSPPRFVGPGYAAVSERPGRAQRTRYHARWVLPVSGPAIADGTVAVEDDRIVYVGTRSEAPDGRDRELGEAILVPGLVNVHTHLDLTVMRGLLEEPGYFGWVRTLAEASRDVLAYPDLLDSARLGLFEGLAAGITTFADTSPSPAPFDAMLECRVRGVAYREVFGPDPAQCEASMTGLRAAVLAMSANQTALVRVGVSPHAPYSVSDELFTAAAAFAREEGLPLATHVAESADESDLVERGEGSFAQFLRGRGIAVAPRSRSPIALLERCGVLAQGTLLIHCVRTDARDVARVADHGCAVAHCPASNAKLGHGIAPLAELLEAGVRVGLGSDSMASNNRMDILGEARLALLAQRAGARDGRVLDAARGLELATIGGARALGLDGSIGTIECGKQADLTAFAIPQWLGPVYEPCDALVWALGGAAAKCVLVAGRELVRDGLVIGAGADVASRVDAAARRLSDWKRAR